MLSPTPLLTDSPHTRLASALIIIPSSPDAEEWRRAIVSQGNAHGIAVSTAEDVSIRQTQPFTINISDNLDDVSTTSYDEKTIILTQAEALGHWTGKQRADVSLLLSALPRDDKLRYITHSSLHAGRSVAVTSFLDLHLDETFGSTDAPVDHALALYNEGPLRTGTVYSWSPADFSIDPRHEYVESSTDIRIDLTGRARCLVHGPYVALPKGVWRATVRFSVDASACRHQLRFEWGPLAQFASFETSARKPGHFTVQITHSFEEAGLCELRLILPESSLGGLLTLEGVDIEMVGDAVTA